MTSATPPVLALPEASDALSSRLAEGLERVKRLPRAQAQRIAADDRQHQR